MGIYEVRCCILCGKERNNKEAKYDALFELYSTIKIQVSGFQYHGIHFPEAPRDMTITKFLCIECQQSFYHDLVSIQDGKK